MAKQVVDTGGFLLLGTSQDPDSLFDGTQVKQATLTLTTRTATAQAIGEGYADEAVVSRSFEIAGTAFYTEADTQKLFAVGDGCYATYYSQSESGSPAALDQILFQGNVVVTKVSDTQSQGEYETQEISVRSTGTPTKPPYS
ncbi:MAG: hypothetical protein HYU66_05505 [Armatimonadetes bacterium]|nr:hypothetical protein [Armatimonadota bacterium]